MGTSTDAILFFGFTFSDPDNTEDDPAWMDGDTEWEEAFALTKGLSPPSEEYAPNRPLVREAYSKYWSEKNALADAQPCGIDIHCSGDFPMRFVHITASKKVANRGEAVEIESLTTDHAWREQLQEFCTALGIKWQEPKWWMVSYWG